MNHLVRLYERVSAASVLTIVAWTLILAVALYYVIQSALPFLTLNPSVYEPHGGHGGWLFLHVAGGIVALLVGPLQFWSGLRRKHLRLHRWSGRVYLGSVAVSVAAAIYILLLPHSSFGFRIGIAGLAFAWISTSGLAYLAIRWRQIVQHKEWMIRSYVVTFGFVTFRGLLEGSTALEIATFEERVSAASWMCWAVPLLITELVLQGRKVTKQKNVRSGDVQASASSTPGRRS